MITINMDKAKAITHEARRAARADEFKPHDAVIMKQIPGADAVAAEAARQEIRAKYAAIQENVESASTPEELKQIIDTLPKQDWQNG